MASMFSNHRPTIRLLDAGAGTGSLIAAFVADMAGRHRKPEAIFTTAYEICPDFIPQLRQTLDRCAQFCAAAGIHFASQVHEMDFISAAADMLGGLLNDTSHRFDCAILNPPYRKIGGSSDTRRQLRRAGIETSNLYPAFLALAAKLLDVGGKLVAITPRSFCNGPYFRPFRRLLLDQLSLRGVHLFQSRTQTFVQDAVLQENLILHAIKGRPAPTTVLITSSLGPGHPDRLRFAPMDEVVHPGDADRFIHLGTQQANQTEVAISRLPATLPDLGIGVSTGRVVDFRCREFLRTDAAADTVPLIYPTHFSDGLIQWPKHPSRKPNAIVACQTTLPWLVPAGTYVLIHRFSPKEEPRRIVAAVYDGTKIPAPYVGFENHLNYFHINGGGIPANLARGLAVFLNSTGLDAYFRQFSGHTQVNAADLKRLRYPDRATLKSIGERCAGVMPPQQSIDAMIEAMLGDAWRDR
ncbi:MAG: SAM-dependent methyltransferase [Phycisphaerae bacterium]|nr:SAM-dependent methyltransferase [Phycisphaerae bacterium]